MATPLEQEINGVENSSTCCRQATATARCTITVTFELGTDLDTAQVLVQNRVAIAEPRLPEEVRARGVTVRKNSPDLMMVIHLNSPDGSLDQLYISNYAHAAGPRRASRASRASARRACSAPATTRCASGSTPSGWPSWA